MLRYCALLELNNNRAWFHDAQNYKLYQEAKQDFTDLVEQLKFRVAELVDPELAERLIFAQAKDLLYRIPRDMRANRGKPPYNPSWRADIAADHHVPLPVGYFMMIAPGDRSHFGTGAWCWNAELLLRVRTYISENFDRFEDAMGHCGMELQGNRLKNVPRGFDPDDPAGEYLKFKSWFVTEQFADSELTDFDSFTERAAAAVERMEPLRRFFNDALSQKKRCPWDVGDWE